MCKLARQPLRPVSGRWAVRRKGQTLVELLVVVALIALLIATLVPSLRRSMRIAASTVCKSNLREIGHGLDMYRWENDGWLPAVTGDDPDGTGTPEDLVWFLRLYPSYLPDPLVLRCPEDPFGYRLAKARDNMDSVVVGDYASYGINSFIMTDSNGVRADLDRHRPTRPLATILISDMGPDVGGNSQQMNRPLQGGPPRNTSLLSVDDGFDPFDPNPVAPWVTVRHGDGINMLTIGGGVHEARTVESLQDPINRFYANCAAGGCTLCNDLRMFHYSFAKDRLYWWTGPARSE